MNIGYAYAATPAEARALPDALRSAGAEKVWLDHDTRDERAILFARDDHGDGVALRQGDRLILLRRGHLGVGKEIPRFEALAGDMGVEIVVIDRGKMLPQKPGPARAFPKSDEEARVARHYWQGPYRRRDAIVAISERLGRPVTAAQLNRHIGPRGGPQTEEDR